MKWHWIQQNKSQQLILFFNGWGMDHYPVQGLLTDSVNDLLMLYDYRTLELDNQLKHALSQYDVIGVVAWSLGVWAYTQIASFWDGPVSTAIAVNGTSQPIHADYGIAPKIYQATLDNFSIVGRDKFFKRMCGNKVALTRFQQTQPHRSIHDQQAELQAIQQLVLTTSSAATHSDLSRNPYNYALIGKQDKIITTKNQLNFWEGQRPYTIIDMPHFPFFQWNRWLDIFAYATKHS